MTTTDRSPDAEIPRYLMLLWGRSDPAPRRGPRPALTIRDIGTAAVTIADSQGLEAVSMKAIATELGLTPMSLYRYVDSKDDVLEVMVDTAYGPAPRELTVHGDWRTRITAWAMATAEMQRHRPWLSTVALVRPPVAPNMLSWTESGVQCFAGTTLSGQQKMSALLLVDGFVRQHVRLASQMGMLGDTSGDNSYETMVRTFVDADGFPHLSAAAAETDSADDDFFTEQLDFGLTVILDGVAALIERSRASTSDA